MNKPVDPTLLQTDEAFADYLTNTAARFDTHGEAVAAQRGARVGISLPHESAALHVAGEAAYIDDLPELAGTPISNRMAVPAEATITSRHSSLRLGSTLYSAANSSVTMASEMPILRCRSPARKFR